MERKIEYERVGLKEERYRILGIDLPCRRFLAREEIIAAIVESVSRNHILKQQGIFTAVDLEEKIPAYGGQVQTMKTVILSEIPVLKKPPFAALRMPDFLLLSGAFGKNFLSCFNWQGIRFQMRLVVDIREKDFFEEWKHLLIDAKLKHGAEIIFLESSDESLIKRFKETRRSHPILDAPNVRDALKEERRLLGWIKEIADNIIDTSNLTLHELRRFVLNAYGHSDVKMRINLMSFGYAYGLPMESDMVLDVRFLPNPYFVDELKGKTAFRRSKRLYSLEGRICPVL